MKKNKKKLSRKGFLAYVIFFAFITLCFILCGSYFLGLLFGLFTAFLFYGYKNYDKLIENGQKVDSPKADLSNSNVVPTSTSSNAGSTPLAQNIKKYKVAGVTSYVDNILALAVEDPDYEMSKRELIDSDKVQEKVWKYFFAPKNVDLVFEPENPYDPNAIKVIVDGEHVGYIKSGSCAHLRNVIERDGIVDIDCTIGGGPYKYVSVEYDDEKDKEIYTLEKDSINLFVHLEITEKN